MSRCALARQHHWNQWETAVISCLSVLFDDTGYDPCCMIQVKIFMKHFVRRCISFRLQDWAHDYFHVMWHVEFIFRLISLRKSAFTCKDYLRSSLYYSCGGIFLKIFLCVKLAFINLCFVSVTSDWLLFTHAGSASVFLK